MFQMGSVRCLEEGVKRNFKPSQMERRRKNVESYKREVSFFGNFLPTNYFDVSLKRGTKTLYLKSQSQFLYLAYNPNMVCSVFVCTIFIRIGAPGVKSSFLNFFWEGVPQLERLKYQYLC